MCQLLCNCTCAHRHSTSTLLLHVPDGLCLHLAVMLQPHTWDQSHGSLPAALMAAASTNTAMVPKHYPPSLPQPRHAGPYQHQLVPGYVPMPAQPPAPPTQPYTAGPMEGVPHQQLPAAQPPPPTTVWAGSTAAQPASANWYRQLWGAVPSVSSSGVVQQRSAPFQCRVRAHAASLRSEPPYDVSSSCRNSRDQQQGMECRCSCTLLQRSGTIGNSRRRASEWL